MFVALHWHCAALTVSIDSGDERRIQANWKSELRIWIQESHNSEKRTASFIGEDVRLELRISVW